MRYSGRRTAAFNPHPASSHRETGAATGTVHNYYMGDSIGLFREFALAIMASITGFRARLADARLAPQGLQLPYSSGAAVLKQPVSTRLVICELVIWTDPRPDGSADASLCRGRTQLPLGAIGMPCPKCGTDEPLVGALISQTADEKDPNILCLVCGYWRD
jgi:hypothetical protein